ncbi:MAG: PAS domain S-box protein [Nitrospira sp.]|nr:PAS domain S-box protein [Nitrospira sp.]
MSAGRRKSYEDLVKENEELRAQLEEAQEVLTAIRTGQVDALVVDGPKGEQVYSLTGVDHPYRIFVEHMNEGAVTIDADGMIVYANRLFADLIGLSLEQAVGAELQRFVSPTDLLLWDELIREANGEASRGELSLLSASGESIPVLLSFCHLPIEPGSFYCCIVSDLRGQRLHEQLTQSEERFRTMAQAVPSFLFEADAEGSNIWTSESWCRFTGQTPDQVAGHGWAEALHPEDRASNIDRWVYCMEEGVPFESQQRLRRADGTYAWVMARALPVRDDQGVIHRWVGSVTDVDAIVRVQDALRQSNDLLEGLITSAMDAVITIDGDQRILLFNPAAERMFGCLAADVLGSSIDRFIPGRFQATHRAHVQQFRKDGTTGRRMGELGTLSGVRANGEEFPIEASISQMVSGGTRLFTVIVRDITDRKRAEDALQQRHRQLELLALASQRLLHGGDSEEELLEPIFLDIARLVDMEMFYHYRSGEDDRMLRLQLSGGITEKERTRFATMGFGELLCGRVAERRERILVEDLQHSPHPGGDVLRAAGATSYAGFPLVANGQLVGTIAFVSNRRTHLCDGDIQMIQTICDQIATALERTKLQRELRENEERLRLALDGADLGSWDVDLKTDVAVWNRRHALLQGYEPETGPVSMDQWRKLVHPDDLDRVMAAIERAKRERTLFTEEHRLYRADTKEMRWLSLYGRFFYDENGEPERFSGVSFDVTERKQAEENLRSAHGLIETLLSTAPVGFGFLSRELRFERVNQRLADMNGVPVASHIGKHVRDIVPSLAEMAYSVRNKILSTGQPVLNQEFAGETSATSGEHRFWNESWYPIRDQEERILGFGVVVEDITVRKQTEAQVREGQERLRLATQAAAVGIWEWNVKTNQIRWDAQMFKIYQAVPTGDRLVPYGTWSQAVWPDDLPEQERILWETVRTQHSSSRQFRIRRYGDGEIRHIDAVETVRTDEQGETEWVVGTNIDVTERRRAEDALRESEARYRATFANAAVGIGRVAFHNATWIDVNEALCRLVGYSREEMLRTPWPNITHPDDLDLDLVPFQRMAAGRLDSYTVEKRFIHKLGHSVWARLTLSLARDAAGHPLYEICIAEDIQERKWAESILMDTQERLEHWNQELERAVHEKTAELQQSHAQLRALASELTLTEHRERKRLATELHDHLQQMLVVGKLTIGQGKRHAIGMPQCEAVFKKVDDILAEALTYSRTLVAELSPPVLRDHGLVIGVRWLVDYMKQKHEHSVTVLVPEGTEIEVSEDHTLLLFQSVRELLINSAKHAGTGEATVTLEDQEGHLVITVSDTGNGFDLAAAAAAGSPNGGLSSKFGLFSIQERMRALGGIFDIQSAPGQGTIARLTLPLGGRSSEAATDDPGLTTDLSLSKDSTFSPQSSASTQDSRIRVLLVDDHTLVRQSLGAMLNGYPDMAIVGEAANGEEAVRLAEELHPAVVVMDINMPKMDGIEATGRITNRHPDIAVIGLSVNAGGENQEAMSHAGAVRLMTKESAMEELHSAIQEAVRR